MPHSNPISSPHGSTISGPPIVMLPPVAKTLCRRRTVDAFNVTLPFASMTPSVRISAPACDAVMVTGPLELMARTRTPTGLDTVVVGGVCAPGASVKS